MPLLGDLEFAGVKNLPVVVSQLIDINTATILCKIDRGLCSNVLLFEYHLS